MITCTNRRLQSTCLQRDEALAAGRLNCKGACMQRRMQVPHAAVPLLVRTAVTNETHTHLKGTNCISEQLAYPLVCGQKCVHATPRTAREQQTKQVSHIGAS